MIIPNRPLLPTARPAALTSQPSTARPPKHTPAATEQKRERRERRPQGYGFKWVLDVSLLPVEIRLLYWSFVA